MKAKIIFFIVVLAAYARYLQASQDVIMAQLRQIDGLYAHAIAQTEGMANNAGLNTELVQYSSGK